MKTLATLVAAIFCAAPLGAQAGSFGPDGRAGRELAFASGGRGGDGGSLPGAPGGRGGASGIPDRMAAASYMVKLKRYCSEILDSQKPDSQRPANGRDYRPSDCAAFFYGLGDPAAEHPSSGWGGIKGRRRDGGRDEALESYCMMILADPERPPTSSEGYRPADCVDLFSTQSGLPAHSAPRRRHAHDGADGPSIAGGIGGRGGRAGAGHHGGVGGAGGAGSMGGVGGRGGAGGASD